MRTFLQTAAVGAWLLLLHGAFGQECTADGSLCDTHERCPVWKEEGECIQNADYMKKHCPASCVDFSDDTSGADVSDETSGECKDRHERCKLWAQAGECKANAANMKKYCPKACNICTAEGDEEEEKQVSTCVDSHPDCAFWAESGECEANRVYMHKNCAKRCGTCVEEPAMEPSEKEEVAKMLQKTLEFGVLQEATGSEKRKTLDAIRSSVYYMENEIDSLPSSVVDECLNRNVQCAFWAAIGECEKNEAFMLTNCAPSCKTCHMIDMETRCPKLEDATPALKPGQLNEMFERIVETAPGNRSLTDDERRDLQLQGTPEYTVHVHSRPTTSGDEISRKIDMSSPPWVITLDNFTTPEECQRLIDLGYKEGYARSKDVSGKKKFDGSFEGVESTGRTSENAWCSIKGGCRTDEVVQNIMTRMGMVMGIPADNSEDLQLLKYEPNQFYNRHHDYIEHQRDRQCGPRILTFFLYLTDVEEGGGTKFNNLAITVTPKVGRALLWPSVLNSEPMNKDGRTMHEAMPVIAGTKFAANGWVHMFDYVAPQAKGCN
jgi:prolyl 4-hydroxylase